MSNAPIVGPSPSDANAVFRCISAILDHDLDVYRATLFVSPKHTIKVTRRHKRDQRERRQDFVVAIGVPNWHERQRVKQFIKVGEPFPVKKVQLTFRAKKRSV